MDVQLLVVPYDSGHRGARMGAGPLRLIEAGIERKLSEHGHQIRTTFIELDREAWRSEIAAAFELMRRVQATIGGGHAGFPIILAGNCNTSLGALAASSPRTGIVWFDAHADFNTPDTTISGFLDGTALSTLTGGSWRQLALTVPGFTPLSEDTVCIVGARDLDPSEKKLLSRSAVTLVGPEDVRSRLPETIAALAGRVDACHVHIDLDVLDASVARANSYAAGGGLTIDDMEFALECIARDVKISGVTLSAYDPEGDADGVAATAAMQLVSLVTNLAVASFDHH